MCDEYTDYLYDNDVLLECICKGELSYHDLMCHCKPKRCHGDQLALLATYVEDHPNTTVDRLRAQLRLYKILVKEEKEAQKAYGG